MRTGFALALTGLATLFAAPATAQDTGGFCAGHDWQSRFSADLVCVDTPHGAAIAPTGEAEDMAAAMETAAARFERYFVPVTALVVVYAGAFTPEQTEYVESLGYVPFPWLTEDQMAGMAQDRMASAQMTGDLDPEKRDQALAAARSRASAQRAGGSLGRGTIAHELGHLWLKKHVNGIGESDGYGSALPDWVDEVAAVLNENPALAAHRRAGLADLIAGEGNKGLYPLSEYLSMPHPLLASETSREAIREAIARQSEANGGSGVVVLSGAEAEELMAASNPLRFYIQSRAFADFLIERSGDARIMLSIVDAMKEGTDFGAWLAAQGRAHGLAADLPDLERDWKSWLAAQ